MLRTRIVLVHPGQRAPPPREDIGRSRPADVFTLPPLTLVGLTITDVEDLDWASCQSVGKAAWFLGQANTVPCLRHRAITERRHKASNSTVRSRRHFCPKSSTLVCVSQLVGERLSQNP